jgi:hypothetical protein
LLLLLPHLWLAIDRRLARPYDKLRLCINHYHCLCSERKRMLFACYVAQPSYRSSRSAMQRNVTDGTNTHAKTPQQKCSYPTSIHADYSTLAMQKFPHDPNTSDSLTRPVTTLRCIVSTVPVAVHLTSLLKSGLFRLGVLLILPASLVCGWLLLNNVP